METAGSVVGCCATPAFWTPWLPLGSKPSPSRLFVFVQTHPAQILQTWRRNSLGRARAVKLAWWRGRQVRRLRTVLEELRTQLVDVKAKKVRAAC